MRTTILVLIVSLSIIPAGHLTSGLQKKERPEIVVQQGHSLYVTAVTFTPDGKNIVSGSALGQIKVWDVLSGKEMRSFSGHSGAIQSLTVSPDGKTVISVSANTIKHWDLATGKEYPSFIDHPRMISHAVFLPDGRSALIGSNEGVKQWDIRSGKIQKTFSGTRDYISSLTLTSDGKTAVSRNSGRLDLWDVTNAIKYHTILAHSDDITSVAISTGQDIAISGSKDKTVKIWDLNSAKELQTFTGHTSTVKAVAISPDGKKAFSASENMIKQWNVLSRNEITSTYKHTRNILCMAYSPDGKKIVYGSANTLVLWDTELNREIRIFAGFTAYINSVSFSPDGKLALIGSGNSFLEIQDYFFDKTLGKQLSQSSGQLKLWDITKAKEIRTFLGHTAPVTVAAFSPDGKRMLSGSIDHHLKLWNVATAKEIVVSIEHSDPVLTASFAPDGKSFVTGTKEKLSLWNSSNGKKIITLVKREALTSCAAFSPDGKKLIASTSLFLLKLWDIENEEEILTLSGHQECVTTAVFSPDGKSVISGSDIGELILWDISTGKKIKSFVGHTAGVTSVTFSPDGKTILSGSKDKTIKMWDVATGGEIKTFSGHFSYVTSVAFSADGKCIISGSWDGTTRIWNLYTGEWTVFMSNQEGTEWITFNGDGFWDASPNGGDLVAMVQGMQVWNIDQFAVTNNRPDRIIQELPLKDTVVVNHLFSQHQKRLRKLNLSEENDSRQYDSPETKIVRTAQNNKILTVDFLINSRSAKITRYNIYVNDVPLFGAYGKETKQPSAGMANSLSITEQIELTFGENKIEISAMNEFGAESYRAPAYAAYTGPVHGDLYFIGFGISRYRNPDLNLEYADKDAVDLSNVMGKMKDQFKKIWIATYLNEDVTVKNIQSAKELLKNAKPDDTFVLFIAGHGMYDRGQEAGYYYLTYDADPDNLKNSAANFELIENILQGVAPRNKLFLMDACESGEIEEDLRSTFIAQSSHQGLRSRGMKSVQSENVPLRPMSGQKRDYLYQKDRYIYNDLARRSGAIVFSSSKGGEFSYERSDIKNGLFTSSVITAMTTNAADANNDGLISTDEIRSYVAREVATTSKDLQHPTVDRDNIFQKFGFSIVK